MRTQVKALVGVLPPAPSEPWAHSCGVCKILELQGDECSHLYHCSQQGRANATHDAALEQLRDILLGAKYGYGWRVERTHENPGELEYPRTWRADLFGFDNSGVCVLVGVSVTCLAVDSAKQSRGEDMRGRVEALLRDVEMRKIRNPRVEAAIRARYAFFAPLV